ncbi:CapA family protein [Streptomyces griseocarneus]|uniref:CapA family protein n=1 Tax=Streptomyces griseocarneus TaxID=51201 RepID=UPI00167D14EA|nr:CapA family protein [Streptomyces griseocarneus]MBZ6472576.1 CapA family protein [Streptomyces griseocarneus]GHG46039.1 poly-gamma-glutamate biosynthesis protein [Streptomyces griseocarneus]
MKRFPRRRLVPAVAAAALIGTATAGCAYLGVGDDAAEASFTLAAGGDVLIHPEITDQANKDAKEAGRPGPDFGAVMAGIKPVVSKADLAVCHLETVMAEPKGPFLGYRKFSVPPQIAGTLKDIGYDTCSTASNHTLDHGPEAVKRTLDTLDRAGIKHTGSARSEKEAATPNILDVKGVKVAQLSYAYGFNDTTVPKDKPWLVNEIDVKRMAADEKAARAAGAEVVFASVHWGREGHNEASKGQLRLAQRIAKETGIDLVIGHHAHVVQPFEKVGDTWVAYGLGNQVARHAEPLGTTEEGAMGWFEFSRKKGKWSVSDARFVPTLVELEPKIRLVDVGAALRREGLTEEQRARYRTAYERTRGIVLNRGADDDGLSPLTITE